MVVLYWCLLALLGFALLVFIGGFVFLVLVGSFVLLVLINAPSLCFVGVHLCLLAMLYLCL
jgi:hypothetical protein